MGGHKTTTITSGKRVDGIQLQSSSYGGAVPLVYGTNRIPANLIWYGDFQAIPHTSTQSSGGKGGTSKQTTQNTTYTYQAAVAMALAEGPAYAITRCWRDKDQIAMQSTVDEVKTFGWWKLDVRVNEPWALFTGNDGQSAWSYLQSKHPDQALNYNRLAYVGAGPIDLDSSGALQNHNFEIMGLCVYNPSSLPDANPKDIVVDFLTDPYHGVPGWGSGRLGDLTQYSNYCIANNLLLSPALTDQSTAADILQRIADSTNTLIVWSEGKLKFVPRGDDTVSGNGVTYTPNNTPVYDLADDDFLDTGNDPVRLMRKRPADAYNRYPVEYANRANAYALDVVEAKDQGDIALHGLRKADKQELHMICNVTTAMAIAQILLQRSLYIRNTFEFDLDWRYSLLEPGDLVTLTDQKLGLNRAPVQITGIAEIDDGYTVTAEEYPYGVNSHSLYGSASGNGYAPDLNSDPGGINAPVIFEAPDTLTAAGLEIWMGVSGQGTNWGGCDVWVSEDDASYQKIGTIHGPARQGVLVADLPAGTDPDSVNTLSVDLSQSRGSLTGGTQSDADHFNTLCFVDGELISFETASLNASYEYGLSYLRRGAYNTPIGAHAKGANFVRLDQAIFRYAFGTADIGKHLYLKFSSFNVYGGGEQDLSALQAYQYTIKGSAASSPLPNVGNLVSVYRNGQQELAWDAVADYRPVTYEIRKGTQANTAEIVGTTAAPNFVCLGDGTYYVAAKYQGVYSSQWAEITISGARLTSNVVASYDEAGDKWPGTLGGGAYVQKDGTLVLRGAGKFSSMTDVGKAASVVFNGDIYTSGTYEIPAAHQVDVGQAEACSLSASYTMYSASPYQKFSQYPDIGALQSIIGNYAGHSDVRVQVAVAQNDGVFGSWADFVPGTYVGRIFKFRLLLSSSDAKVTAMITSFKFTVDMPDKLQSGTNISIPAAGTRISYSPAFHGGANGQPTPGPNITILNAADGDKVVLTNQALDGFNVQITNNGTGVARSINWIAQGY